MQYLYRSLVTQQPSGGMYTSDMQGMVWGEPELSHVWVFHHMVFFHSHNVNEVWMRSKECQY